MNDTLKNREAIQQMLDANAAGISAENQRELIEQALIQLSLGPDSITSAAGETINYRSPKDLIAVEEYIEKKNQVTTATRGLSFTQLIPPGGGGTP